MADPHDREYAAAAAAIHDQTPPPGRPVFAVGDFVSGRSAGRHWSGRILIVDGDRLTIELDGGWLAVPAGDVTH
jgi:hypothetical protein